PVGDAEAHHGRAGDGEVFRGEQRQPETADRGLQPLHRDIAGNLEHHLVLDEAGLGGRRNVDDPPVEAGRQPLLLRLLLLLLLLLVLLLLLLLLWLLLLPLLRTGRSRGLLLRRQSDATFDGIEHRRPGGVERSELTWTLADEIIDDLHRSRQRLEEGRGRECCRRRRQDGSVDEPAERIAAAGDDRGNCRRGGRTAAGSATSAAAGSGGAVSTGAGDHARTGRIRDGAGVGSEQGADDAVSTGAGDRAR